MLLPEPRPTAALRPRSSPLRRWLRRLGIGAIGLLITAALAGAVYQLLGQRLDQRRYPAPGRLLDVGGFKMHLYTTGSGAIPVVLEAGLGGGVLDWYQVQPELARFTQVVSYDHAGVGWSEASPAPRTSAQLVEDLHTLLRRAGIPAPYVLVGHSLGGLHMQLYAMRYPEEVAGLVLVDSSHADMATQKEFSMGGGFPALLRVVAPLGLVRLMKTIDDRDDQRRAGELGPTFVAETSHEASMLSSHTGSLVTMAQELTALPASAAQLRAAPLQLGDKPLFVLTQAGETHPSRKRVVIESIWWRWQADLSSRSHNARHVVAERSGHYIHQDRPDLVVAAIQQTVRAARQGTRLN